MRFSERFRPRRLRDIVGQPSVAMLQGLALRPYASCWLLEGPPGVGKTTAALALANDLGCDQWATTVIKAADLGAAEARELLRVLRYRPMAGQWAVLVIEELTKLHPTVQDMLQTALETELPPHLIVVATTNDASGLREAFRQRFMPLEFRASQAFAKPAIERLATIWASETGEQSLPPDLAKAGWENGESDKRQFSLRVALDRLQLALLGRMAAECAA